MRFWGILQCILHADSLANLCGSSVSRREWHKVTLVYTIFTHLCLSPKLCVALSVPCFDTVEKNRAIFCNSTPRFLFKLLIIL